MQPDQSPQEHKHLFVRNEFGNIELPRISVDYSNEYHTQLTESALRLLDIHISSNHPSSPQYKAKIERYFRTINEDFLRHQLGVTSNKIPCQRNYGPQRNAALSLSAVICVLQKWISEIQMPE